MSRKPRKRGADELAPSDQQLVAAILDADAVALALLVGRCNQLLYGRRAASRPPPAQRKKTT